VSDSATASVRERALGHLARTLAEQGALRWLRERAEPEELDVALELFVAVGAVTDQEAENWRRRIDNAAQPLAPDPRLRKSAREHLARLDMEAGERDSERLAAAVAAFGGLGLLTEAEEREWNDRLQAREGPADLDERSQRWMEQLKRVEAFDDSTLLRTLVGPADRTAGICVTFVELAAGGVVVYWHFTAEPGEDPDADTVWRRLGVDFEADDWDEIPDPPDPFESSALTLTDDIGTDYLCAGSGYSSTGADRRVAYGEATFVPAIPPNATRLDVAIEGVGRSVALPLEAP
jgi:hypothetical protein